MMIFETVKETVGTAVDTLATVTQSIIEKNRTNAKLNRLRMVMKSESELMNRAYIVLGKAYYDGEKKGSGISKAEQEKLFEVIEKSKAKIAKARECYRNIIDKQNDIFYGIPETPEYNADEVVDITVACSNESEYTSSPFENTSEPEQVTEAVDTKDKLTDLKEELESIKNAESKFADTVDTEEAEDTESPQGELF